MEFDENGTKPESTRTFLIQQVEEQSELCDVTVKVGHWERRFHRCVLVKSPFFECVFRNEYREKQSKTITINIGSPVTVEMALLFLYGKKPKLTSDNAETLMMLAEFFLIPNLKAACVAWLKAIEVTDKNCLELLQLASLFSFELPECMAYMEGDVNELLLKQHHHVKIDSQTVEYIFTDRKFSYIPMDERLKFLMRWTQVNHTSRLEKAQELAKCVNFSDISIELLKEVESDTLYGEITKTNIPPFENESENKYTEVLIMPDDNKRRFWCFDIKRIRWFKLKTSLFNQREFPFINIKGVSKSESTAYSDFIYCSTSYYDPNIIVCVNLETDIVQSYSMIKTDDSFPNFKHVEMFDNVCIASEDKTLTRSRILEREIALLQRQNENRELMKRQKLLMRDISLGLCTRNIEVETSTIYVGRVEEDNIDMEPLFTIINGNVSKICINSLYSIALMVHSKNRIFIYDMINCKLEIIEESLEMSDELCSSEDGFVIFNNKRCICLRKLQQTTSGSNYEKTGFEFGHTCKYLEFVKMFFVKDHWYRYVYKRRNETSQFEWIHYDKMLATEDEETADWTILPLPIDASKCYKYTFDRPIFHIRVPKSILKCDIECLHCEHKRNTWTNSKTVNRAVDSYEEYTDGYDEYWKDVSSEDDFCERKTCSSDSAAFMTGIKDKGHFGWQLL